MRLNRRQLFEYAFTFFAIATTSTIQGGAAEPDDWKARCRRWMRALVPADEKGSGADTPAVWEHIERTMDSDPQLKQSLQLGLSVLGEQRIPETDGELKYLHDRRGPTATFVAYLHGYLVDSYYATEAGWTDLGIRLPPQPKGFPLPGDAALTSSVQPVSLNNANKR